MSACLTLQVKLSLLSAPGRKGDGPSLQVHGREVSPGLHGSKQCHPLSLTSTCTTTDLLEPHHVAAPESWSVSLPIGLALRIVWGGISPGGRCAIMEAKRCDTCASLSETIIFCIIKVHIPFRITHQYAICCVDSRHEFRTMRFKEHFPKKWTSYSTKYE